MDSKFNIRSLLITGMILTFLNTLILFTIIGKGVYDQISGKEKEGTIVLANVDPETANKVTGQFTYQSTSGEGQQYYSPLLDSLLTYDSSKYFISEGVESVFVSQRGLYNTDIYTNLKLADESFTLDTFKSTLEYIYSDVKLEEEVEIEGLKGIRYSYVKESFVDNSKSIYNTLYIYKTEGKKTIYATIVFPDGAKVTEISSDVAKIINKADMSPDDISSDIKLVVPKGGVELTYDRKKWIANSTTESTANLDFRSSEYETKEENKYAITSISIMNSVFGKSDTLESFHDIYTSSDLERYKDSKLNLKADKKETVLAGKTFIYSEYTYDYFGKINTTKVYTTLDESKEISITIKVWVNSPGTVGETEATELLKTLNFVKVEETETQSSIGNGNGNVLGSSSLEIEKSALIGKPSVVHIYNRTCLNVEVSKTSGLMKTPNKKYESCSGGFGTGFFVSSDGYLVTNGHVASPSPIDGLIIPLITGAQYPAFWNDFAVDIAYVLSTEMGIDARTLSNQDLMLVVLSSFLELNDKGLITITPSYSNYVETDTPFNIDRQTFLPINEASLLSTTLIDSQVDSLFMIDYNAAKNNQQAGIKTPDLAILKVNSDSKEYPTLKFSSLDLITSGMSIHVLGFPGIADSSAFFATNASQIPTITKGTISAVKPSTTGEFNMVQIDAAISHGNSGGPILNSNGEVVAVATYGMGQAGGSYNIGVSIEEVNKMLADQGITVSEGEITKYLNSGINNLEKAYYKYAIKDLEKVIELYPEASEVITPLISIAKSKIEAGEDKTPIINTQAIEEKLSDLGIKVSGNTVLVAIISAIGLVISLIFVLVLLAFKRKRDRSKQPPIVGNVDTPRYEEPVQVAPSPVQPVVSQPMTEPTPSQPIQSSPVMETPVQTMENTPTPSVVQPPVSPAPFAQPIPTPLVSSEPVQAYQENSENPPANAEPVVAPTPTPSNPPIA